MKKNLKGFTLVEMLIVISIIAILSGAILAGMGSSRSKARNARVVSDVNTMQLIVENTYANGVYPANQSALVTATHSADGADSADTTKLNAIITAGKVIYCSDGANHYKVQGTLEAGKDADDVIKSTVSGTIGACTCPVVGAAGANTLFCVGE
jgi:prepilin-type N-terminal cleavage/methylation domain-containing protein